ncbi:MAG: carbamoyltransferase N-terminal domain-containing protein [Gammaproteobacteria bacterium]|nr:carbamoyltransferase N-terminal domain-containing protein [Gammaproteobacteria bacterium]
MGPVSDVMQRVAGVMMNSVLTGRILKETPLESLFIQPASGDAGTALGAVYSLWHERLGRSRGFVMEHAFWGSFCDSPDVERVIDPVRTDQRFEVRSI